MPSSQLAGRRLNSLLVNRPHYLVLSSFYLPAASHQGACFIVEKEKQNEKRKFKYAIKSMSF